jgi:hypothetical protein
MQFDSRYKTAFFHEFGHYVAHEVNRISPQTKVTEIILRPHKTLNRIDGCLCHDYTNESLAQKLANIVHGCFFESLILEREDFNVCFAPQESGEKDMCDFNIALSSGGIDSNSDRKEKLWQLNENYYSKLKQCEKVKEILNLDVPSYLVPHQAIQDAYLVNLDKLAADIPQFLEDYRKEYAAYLNDIQVILDI